MKKLLPEDSDFDKILAYYQDKTGESKLSLRQAKNLEVWETVHDLLKSYGTVSKVWPMIAKKYVLSRAQSYRYIREAQKFFGMQVGFDKNYYRMWFFEKCVEQMEAAEAAGDHKAAASFMKLIKETLGFDQADAENAANAMSLQLTQINIVMDPEKVGLPKIDNIEAAIAKFSEKKRKLEIEANE